MSTLIGSPRSTVSKRLGEIAEHQEPRGVDAGGRFRDAQLHGGELGHAAVAAGHRAAGGAHLGHVEDNPRARPPPCRAPAKRWRSAARRGTTGDRADWDWRACRGRWHRRARRMRACDGRERTRPRRRWFLLPVPASPMVCQLSSMRAVGGRHQEESGLRRRSRLRDHAAEKLPLRIVAAAAEAALAGQPIAAVDGDRLRRPAHRCRQPTALRSLHTSSCASREKQAMSHWCDASRE